MFKAEGSEQLNVSNYMRFQEGANKIRILKEPVTGFEYWVDSEGKAVDRGELAGEGGKPIRARRLDGIDRTLWGNTKAFAAMIVWNYSMKKVQILEIKQSKIMSMLDALYDNEDWGDVTEYDITITRTKTGDEARNVEYTVTPSPKKQVSEEVLEAYNTNINLEALFTGDDPFESISDEDIKKIAKEV